MQWMASYFTSVLPARFPCLPRISLERALRFSINMKNVSGTRVPKTKVVNFLRKLKANPSEKGREKRTRTFFTFYHRLGEFQRFEPFDFAQAPRIVRQAHYARAIFPLILSSAKRVSKDWNA